MPTSCDRTDSISDAMGMYSPEAFPDKPAPYEPPTDDPVKPRTTPDPFAAPDSPTTAFASLGRGAANGSDEPEDSGDVYYIETREPKPKSKSTSKPTLSFSSFLQGKIDSYRKSLDKVFDRIEKVLKDNPN